MDRRERFSSLTLMLQAALAGLQSGIWTALPGAYQGPGKGTGTANVQPSVQVQTLNQDGFTWNPPVNLPVCLDCPILFPGGGGAHLTFPLKAGDEGLLVFASRCIDNWWVQGGQQSQAEYRMHDLSDGFFIPGCFSQMGKPAAAWSTDTVRLTADDGLSYVELDPVAKVVTVLAPGGINLEGPLDGPLALPSGTTIGGVAITEAAGVLLVAGGLDATGEVRRGVGTGDQVTLGHHTHVYNEPTGPNVSAPTTAPTAGT